MSSTADLLNRLRYFVRAEAETQYAALDQQWSRPLAERVAKGWAVEGLRVEHFEKGLIRLAGEFHVVAIDRCRYE